MLILNSEMGDVRIVDGRIAEIGRLVANINETVIDADGGALLPGLHDHHIHLCALAAQQASVPCGPPLVRDIDGLAAALSISGTGWIRGVGYHESVAGMLDKAILDRIAPDRPVRIQHRGGRMWFLNSLALDMLLSRAPAPPCLDLSTGQLFDDDSWLRQTLGSVLPDLAHISGMLARYGVTGITDLTPRNDLTVAAHFAYQQACGHLRQKLICGGTLALEAMQRTAQLRSGPAKLHLHEAAFPAIDDAVLFVRAAHDLGSVVAVHCTTEAELVFALAVFRDAKTITGDRIEHASVAPNHLVKDMAELGLCVVVQPHFLAERGDAYMRDIEAREWPTLYRLRGLKAAGLTMAGGSDAPFGSADPWAAMRAAVSRQTPSGVCLAPDEALSPEEALSLFTSDPENLAIQRRINIGMSADLCLLDRPWAAVRTDLSSNHIRMTMIDGAIVHGRC